MFWVEFSFFQQYDGLSLGSEQHKTIKLIALFICHFSKKKKRVQRVCETKNKTLWSKGLKSERDIKIVSEYD